MTGTVGVQIEKKEGDDWCVHRGPVAWIPASDIAAYVVESELCYAFSSLRILSSRHTIIIPVRMKNLKPKELQSTCVKSDKRVRQRGGN